MLLLFMTIAVLHIRWSSTQSLSAFLNPGCNNCSNISVVSVVFREQSSSVHFIVSITKENSVPSVFVSRSGSNSSVYFDWPSIFSNEPGQSVVLSNSSFYGLLFSNLYQYEDRSDVADISRVAGSVTKYPLNHCFWFLSRWDPLPDPTTGLLSLALRCNGSRPSVIFASKGFIELEFTFSEKDRLADRAPHTLLLGGLAVRVMVVLQRLALQWKETRWALNLAIVANRSLPDSAVFENVTLRSIDDEPSPGAFKDMTVFLTNHSYVTWKSVCYVDAAAADVKSSRAVAVSPQLCVDKGTNRSLIKSSLFPFVYGAVANTVAVRQVNVSFGDSGDGFYRSSNYIDWSFAFALNTPPPGYYSPLIWTMVVISIILISAAVCLLVYLIGYHFITRGSDSLVRPLLEQVDDSNEQSV